MVRWPGFSHTGTLLLPLRREDWLADDRPRWLDGTCFEPKAEVHVTLLGTAAGQAVREALAAGHGSEAALAQAFEALDWTPRRTGRLLRLRKARPPHDALPACVAESIIECVDLPAMPRFRALVAQATGVTLPAAPPHVTLYVHGDPTGIGVPDEPSLAQYTVAPVDPSCLATDSSRHPL